MEDISCTDELPDGTIGYSLRFILPNAITCVNLLCGFAAIIAASDGEFQLAAVLVLLGLLVDMVDGRVARWLHATSHFGQELDSLADLVSFGVAPSLLIFWFGLGETLPGALLSFLPLLAAAVRLARFNVEKKGHYFIGLPSPGAAALLTGYLLVSTPSMMVLGALSLTSAVLMVSRFRYRASLPRTRYRYGFLVLLITSVFFLSSAAPMVWALIYTVEGLVSVHVPAAFARPVHAALPQRTLPISRG